MSPEFASPSERVPAAPHRRGAVIFQFVVGFGLILAAWLLGVVARVAQRPALPLPPSDIVPPAQFEQLYGEAWDYVNSEFYGDRPAPAAITDGAVEGMVEALDDPWALVATPSAGSAGSASGDGAPGDAASGDDPLAPTYVADLGLWIADTSRGARVLAVAPGDGAAAEAGIEAGDLIVRAENGYGDGVHPSPTPQATEDPASEDGDPVTSGERLPPVSSALTDASLPAVEVVVSRDETSLFARSLVRHAPSSQRPEVAEAEFDARRGLLQIRLPHLGDAAAEELASALGKVLLSDAGAAAEPVAIVLDLRDNPGGSRSVLADVAGYFMTGPVWIERTRSGKDVEHAATALDGGPVLPSADVIVVVNGGTGDEAEMLAAALRDERGARLVGTATFGHGTLQTLRSVGRLQLRLTTGTWRSPGGEDVTDEGLAPDVVVEERSEQDATALSLATGAAEAHAADGGGGGG